MFGRGLRLLLCLFISVQLVGYESQASPQRRQSVTSVVACSSKKIPVLDLAAFADSAGLPTCDVDTDVKVKVPGMLLFLPCTASRHDTLRPLCRSTLPTESCTPSFTLQIFSPTSWALTQRLGFSAKPSAPAKHYINNWDEADLVYVDGIVS